MKYTTRFRASGLKHWAIDFVVVLSVASALPGCTILTEDLELSSTKPYPTMPSRPAVLLPPLIAALTPSRLPERPEASRSIEKLLLADAHPLHQAIPGSERVLLSAGRSRGFSFALPARDKGASLWIAVRCKRPVPLSLLTFDAERRATSVISMRQCPANDLLAGPLDASATSGLLTIPNGSPMHFTVVSGQIATVQDRPGNRWPRNFLR